MAKIKFLTDSAADIPQHYVDELGIEVIHFPIALADREILDGVDYTQQEFYALLDGVDKIPTHAQITPFQFEEAFASAFEAGYDALIYTLRALPLAATLCRRKKPSLPITRRPPVSSRSKCSTARITPIVMAMLS